jgi:hypothetical protein
MMRAAAALALGLIAWAASGDPAHAHAFGQRYELPVPVWLFVIGGALTVTVTFVMVAVFARGGAAAYAAARLDLSRTVLGRVLGHALARASARACGVLVLALALLAGFFGPSDPNANPVPVLIWVAWWVGFSYLVMLVGNPWPLVNPWRTLFDWAARAGVGLSARYRPYPARLGAWPAVGFLLLFFWFELIFPFSAMPKTLATLVVAYSLVTWIGMAVYGPEAWLANADPVHRVFDLYARFAPVGAERRGNGASALMLRPYAAALLRRDQAVAPVAVACFVVALLTGVLFDGLLGSGHWTLVENAVHDANPKLGDVGWVLIHTAAFLLLWLAVLGLFWATCWSMARVAGGGKDTRDHMRAFALTLIPIAVGYHFAHTFTYLLVQGQSLIPLISDPFGLGWNLFGTRAYQIDIAVMSTKAAWYLATGAIVIGHSVSVYLAHVAADRLLASRVRAFRALVPMTILMIVYTVVSLQILAEPLVRYSGPQETII